MSAMSREEKARFVADRGLRLELKLMMAFEEFLKEYPDTIPAVVGFALGQFIEQMDQFMENGKGGKGDFIAVMIDDLIQRRNEVKAKNL